MPEQDQQTGLCKRDAMFMCEVGPRSRLFKYCHVLVTTYRVWIECWIYWTLITRDYTVQISITHTSLLNLSQPSLSVAY
jgi:hypothetical protein